MNLKDVKSLVSLFNSSELTELDWKQDDNHIVLKKEKELIASPSVVAAPVSAAPIAAPAPVAAAAPAASEPAAPSAPATSGDLLEITSPMVGTFYTKPSPDADPYAKVGSTVAKGDVVCIVEAMKLMNEVESDISGEVAEVCVEDGTPVEFGTVLFKVKK